MEYFGLIHILMLKMRLRKYALKFRIGNWIDFLIVFSIYYIDVGHKIGVQDIR